MIIAQMRLFQKRIMILFGIGVVILLLSPIVPNIPIIKRKTMSDPETVTVAPCDVRLNADYNVVINGTSIDSIDCSEVYVTMSVVNHSCFWYRDKPYMCRSAIRKDYPFGPALPHYMFIFGIETVVIVGLALVFTEYRIRRIRYENELSPV